MQTIEAINTALALGDYACPPAGTKVAIHFEHYYHGGVELAPIDVRPAMVVSCSKDYTEIRVIPWEHRHALKMAKEHSRFLWWIGMQTAWFVLELPKDCPPFEEWPRPRTGEERPCTSGVSRG